MAPVKASELRNKNKAELVKLLDEAKQELASLRVQKVAGGSSSKLQEIGRAHLRVKKTRALRRALTPFERNLKTVKEQKKLLAFPARKYAVKA
ncbi:unnamed protein product [Cunninghamella blakesleeana]